MWREGVEVAGKEGAAAAAKLGSGQGHSPLPCTQIQDEGLFLLDVEREGSSHLVSKCIRYLMQT